MVGINKRHSKDRYLIIDRVSFRNFRKGGHGTCRCGAHCIEEGAF